MKRSMLHMASSRRRAVSGVIAMLASVSTAMEPQAKQPAPRPARPQAEPIYSVISPTGEITVKMIEMAPRLDTLSNKTVCMVSNSSFKVNITMPAIAKALQAKYSGLKIIPYTEMATAYSGSNWEAKAGEFKTKGCHAVITGNGG